MHVRYLHGSFLWLGKPDGGRFDAYTGGLFLFYACVFLTVACILYSTVDRA